MVGNNQTVNGDVLAVFIFEIRELWFNMIEMNNARWNGDPFYAVENGTIAGAGITSAGKDAFFLASDGLENVILERRLKALSRWVPRVVREMQEGGFINRGEGG